MAAVNLVIRASEPHPGLIVLTLSAVRRFEASFARGGEGSEARSPKTYLRIHQSQSELVQVIRILIEACMQNVESLTFQLPET